MAERTDQLRRLIDDYKFEYAKAAYRPLAQLVSKRLGYLPSSVVVVPIPTTPAHIRLRGYDHALLLANELARLQNVTATPLLGRVTRTQQRGATKAQRFAQAKLAFRVTKKLQGGTYLLVDDVVTTGATLHFAAKALLDAGADEVWAAAAARQSS